MIAIGKALVSTEVLERKFVCDLKACKGACCVEGVNGAPLTEQEQKQLKEAYPAFESYITEEGKAAVAEQGHFVEIKKDGTVNTPLMDGKACAYTVFENSVASCGIEKAWADGKTDFRKPVSCHLYPIRITSYTEYEAVNYEEWDICNAACVLGERLKVPVYEFTKDALIRKYGEEWYDELKEIAEAWQANQED